jgi:hypothetical protein
MKGSIKRYRRTLFLAIAACGTLVWAAIDRFDVPPREMAQLLGYTVLVVVLVIACAALALGVWLLLRRLLRRVFSQDDSST